MEHLPHGKHPVNIKVPYVCIEHYDHDGKWVDYPEKKGFSLENIRFKMFYKYAPESLPPFLQNWLFFGLLKAILQCDSRTANKDFKYTDQTGQIFITTRALPEYLQRWREDFDRFSLEKRRETLAHNIAILKEARELVYALSGYPSTVSLRLTPFPVISSELSISFAFLGDALETAMRSMMTEADLEFTDRDWWLQSDWATDSLFSEKMEENGWCPFIVSGYAQLRSLNAIYFASTLGPPNDVYDHRLCSDTRCVARTNVSKHARADCHCTEIVADVSEIVKIILEDKVPVLRFYPSVVEGIETGYVRASPYESSIPYVAISHVWSDGLGNPKGNSMPRCQLLRVQEAVNTLYKRNGETESIPFWIDTLCVPNGEGLEGVKNETIRKMAEIYLNADKVLVIDAEVVGCNLSTDPFEILIRICLSNWLRRLWTVQEGVYAKELHFLISTHTISLSELLYNRITDNFGSRTGRQIAQSFSTTFGRSLEQLNPRAALWYLNEDLEEDKEVYMIREIASRTSTYISDETVCIALLLGLDPSTILAVKNADRMRILIDLMSSIIPPGMMLVSGERIPTKGYRWAPRSLMNGPNNGQSLVGFDTQVRKEYPSTEYMPRPLATLDPHKRGLRVTFPGLILRNVRAKGGLAKSFNVKTRDGGGDDDGGSRGGSSSSGRGGVNQTASSVLGKPLPIWRVLYKTDEEDPPWETISPKKKQLQQQQRQEQEQEQQDDTHDMAIIICQYGPYWRNTVNGLLVKIVGRATAAAAEEEEEGEGEGGEKEGREGDKEEMLLVTRVCCVLVGGPPEYDDFEWLKDPESSCGGEWLPVHQVWCVD